MISPVFYKRIFAQLLSRDNGCMKLGVSGSALLITVAALSPCAAFAQVVFTEVMYDLPSGSDSGREWVEVFNAGAAPVDSRRFAIEP